jgi:UDP-N-acetylmuramoylalanine--D-glutamate ligase
MPTNKSNNFKIFELEKKFNNTMVSSVNERLIEIRKKNIAERLSAFQGCGHKLEQVTTLNGIDFIDDASSTNPNATWFALQRMNKPTVWITNLDKVENISDDLHQAIYEKVKFIIIQGVYNSDVYAYFDDLDIPSSVNQGMEDAVRQAFYAAEKGYAVLYSPCSSGSTEDRGRNFKSAVAQL